MTETTCARCHQDYSLGEGLEPSKYCSRCVHDVVDELERRNEAKEAYLKPTMRFVMSHRGDSLGLPPGDYLAISAAHMDTLCDRLTELEQRLARVAELAHDRDGDTLEWRSKRLGKCAQVSWDHMEESFSKDPLKRRSTLKWATLAAQLTAAEERLEAKESECAELSAQLQEANDAQAF